MYNYFGKNIIIVGLGKTGLSCVYFFVSRGIFPRVIDTRFFSPFHYKLPKNIKVHYGSLNIDWLMNADIIVLSPGISVFSLELEFAKDNNIEIIGDIELFCREIDNPIIAITGTNGKSTVVKLISEMAKLSGLKVGVGGNFGLPSLELLKKKYDIYILEISSFQLESIENMSLLASSILNITPNHMDRYFSIFEIYRSIKLKIYENSKFCIFNKMDLNTYPINKKSTCISFGCNDGDYRFNSFDKVLEIKGMFYAHINDINVYGEHNYLNVLVSLALSDILNISYKISLIILKSYQGLDHRCQLVNTCNGIKWINDSKSTNISSTIAAIRSFKTSKDNVLYLILGGDGKDADFSFLKKYIFHDYIKIYCFGKDRKKIKILKKNILSFKTLKECIDKIYESVKFGDIVLFSPACSSLDQFSNFEERGKLFVKLVKNFKK